MVLKTAFIGAAFIVLSILFPQPLYITLRFPVNDIRSLLSDAGALFNNFVQYFDFWVGTGSFAFLLKIVFALVAFRLFWWVYKLFVSHAA